MQSDSTILKYSDLAAIKFLANMTYSPMMKPRPVYPALRSVYDRGFVTSRGGQRRALAGTVSEGEALFLAHLVCQHQLTNTLETGVANGLSALAITLAVAANDGHHIGIDPCQRSEHDEAALVLLEEFGLGDRFTLMEGPAHLEAPKLIAENRKFDLIFIDGMHSFDYKLLDVFLADAMLMPGGFLVMHDLLLQSVKKALRFIQTHRDYEIIPTPELRPGLVRRARYVAGAFVKRRAYWGTWPNGFSNLLVLRKRSDPVHGWDFYKNF